MINERVYQQGLRKILDRGEQLTPIRDRILRIICDSQKHLSSREILEIIAKQGVKASRTSVFRTLDFLTRLSIIRPTFVEAQTPSYVLMAGDGHHAHIICPSCHSIEEIEECKVHDVLPDLERSSGRKISAHLLELYGLCDKCAESSGLNEKT